MSATDLAAVARRAGTGESRCARCRPAGSRRRAGARRRSSARPAMTSTSLLASASVLPASMAASTASRPPCRTTRTEHDVDVRMRRHRRRPSRPARHGGTGGRAQRRATASRAGPLATPTKRRTVARRSARRAAAAFSPAASATTRSRSGWASTTASALRPDRSGGPEDRDAASSREIPEEHDSRRARRTAGCRCGRARRHARE